MYHYVSIRGLTAFIIRKVFPSMNLFQVSIGFIREQSQAETNRFSHEDHGAFLYHFPETNRRLGRTVFHQ